MDKIKEESNKKQEQKYVLNPIYVITIIFGITIILFFISAIRNRQHIKQGSTEYNNDFVYDDVTTEEDIYNINDIEYEVNYQGGDLYDYMVENIPEMQEPKQPIVYDEDVDNYDIDEDNISYANIPQDEHFDNTTVASTESTVVIDPITESNYTTQIVEILASEDYSTYPISKSMDISGIKAKIEILQNHPIVNLTDDTSKNSYEDKSFLVNCSDINFTESILCVVTFDIDESGYLTKVNVKQYSEE